MVVSISFNFGTLLKVTGVLERSADIIIGKAAFFAPEIVTSPLRAVPPVILNASKRIFLSGYENLKWKIKHFFTLPN